MPAVHSYGSMMPIVASNNSGGSDGSAEMELINDTASSMEIMFGIVLSFAGLLGLAYAGMHIIKALYTRKSILGPLAIGIMSTASLASGMALITSNKSENTNTDPSETPTPEPSPEPAPPADPSPAPETHNGPDITVDSTAAIIIAATIAVIALIIAIIIFTKRYKATKFAREAQMTAIKRDIAYAREHIITVSAQYAEAHTNPEYVLYKPLILSDADCVYEFNDKLMHARNTVEECEQMLKRDKPADLEFIETSKLRGLANSLDRDWRELNRKAEQVGTPLLDAGQLRRAETLWAMATNEAATVHERGRDE